MPIDYTRIKKKLTGKEDDGQDVVRLRVGVVSAVNGDGTADVVLSGITVPDVPILGGAIVTVDAVVQMTSYRGSLMIIGGMAGANGGGGGLGLWARGQSGSSKTGVSSTSPVTADLVTNTVTFLKNRVYECRTHGGLQVTAGTPPAFGDLRPYRSGPATQIGEFFRFPIPSASNAFNATGAGVYFTPTVNVTDAVALYIAASATHTISHIAASPGTPRNIEVYDVGNSSQFPGITTW